MKHGILDAIERAARHAGVLIAPAWRTTQMDEEHPMRRLLAHLQVDCMFDVGANVGQYAEKLRRQFVVRGLILSFEPNPAAWDELKASSYMDPLCEIFPFVLGAEPGTGAFNAYDDSKLGSLLEFDHASSDAPHNMENRPYRSRSRHWPTSCRSCAEISRFRARSRSSTRKVFTFRWQWAPIIG